MYEHRRDNQPVTTIYIIRHGETNWNLSGRLQGHEDIELIARVKADIHKGITQFGLDDDNYWSLIRQNALNYWLEWDRNKIFEIEVLNYVSLSVICQF